MHISRRTALINALLGSAVAALPRNAFADTVTYQYDALGRIVTVTYQDGSVITYTYDAAGNRTQVVQAPPGPFTATIAITGSGPVDLRALANAAGYGGTSSATITYTLATNVTISGTAGAINGGAGVDTGTWPGGFAIDLDLQVSGKIYGGGGRGANGADGAVAAGAAGIGGDAIYCRVPIDIVVNSGGQIRSGGGGGGGGGGWSNGTDELYGGGGGGGFPNGPGGTAPGGDATNGAAGTTSGGGASGAGSSAQLAHSGGPGGAGGGAATVGANGTNGAGSTSGWFRGQRSLGAAAGYAVRKNGHTVNVTNNGTISGTVG